MEADFSGYATKANMLCADGVTIAPGAFKNQDKMQVPLVWQHGHTDPENVLGHVLLENRADGVYAYGFFNKSQKAEHTKELLEHKDIDSMSIYANQLIQRAKMVYHGVIREVSLVLSGANPGARIEQVTIRHSDDTEDILEDEAIIYGGEIKHATDGGGDSGSGGGETVQDVYNSLSEKQKELLHFMIGEALSGVSGGDNVSQSALGKDDDNDDNDDPDSQVVYDSMNDAQKELLHFMVGEALDASDIDDEDTSGQAGGTTNNDDQKGTDKMIKHNVFESGDAAKGGGTVLAHSDIEAIVADAKRGGSLKEAVEGYAIAHGIQDIDTLFPDAKTITDAPELFSRRTEWVQVLMAGVRKSPFSRIKTMSADITAAEARAKGYIKGNLKKEEFFRVSKRVTTPTTIYKKQKLDRDDMIDITDFDVVAWLKGEMRLMLDEEVARAILVGDGRAVDDEDKISEDNIRPIASDHELYTTTVWVQFDETVNQGVQVALDQIVLERTNLRGSGQPVMFTTERYISRMLLLRDNNGRKVYTGIDQVASDLRVSSIVPVEILEEYPEIVCIMVNLNDYVVGADRGGNVAMFDDFDIDYNQYKYLIETRASGALVKLKSALVVRKAAADADLVAPAAPTFDGESITIHNTTGVVYRNADTDAVMTNAGSPYAVADGQTVNVHAEPASGYFFTDDAHDDWAFTGES